MPSHDEISTSNTTSHRETLEKDLDPKGRRRRETSEPSNPGQDGQDRIADPASDPGTTGISVTPVAQQRLTELRDLAASARKHKERHLAPATRRYHESDWRQFEHWCNQRAVSALPVSPEIVGLYVTDLARQTTANGTYRYRVASIRRHVASISRRHFEATGMRGLGAHPDIADVVGGIARQRGERANGKRPLMLADLRRVINAMDHATWPAGVAAARDRLAILIGFAAALRRSEAAALTVGQIEIGPGYGMIIRLGRTKTDQEGAGSVKAIGFGRTPATCVPCHYLRWLRLVAAQGRAERIRQVVQYHDTADEHVCPRKQGPDLDTASWIFRAVDRSGGISDDGVSGDALHHMLLRRLNAAGIDPAGYGFHSLRAGFVTEARRNGVSARAVRRQTGHRSDAMVDHYDRDNNPLHDNAVTWLGL